MNVEIIKFKGEYVIPANKNRKCINIQNNSKNVIQVDIGNVVDVNMFNGLFYNDGRLCLGPDYSTELGGCATLEIKLIIVGDSYDTNIALADDGEHVVIFE